MDYTLHRILQARILEWVTVPVSKVSSQPRDQTQVSCIAGEFFISWATREAPRPSRTNTKKRCPFNPRWLECKSRKSRNTWSNRQVWPWSTKWSRAKANRVLSREHTGHGKHPFPTTQEATLHMDINKWSILKLYGLHSLQLKMEKLCTVSKNKIWSWLWLRSSAPYWKIHAWVEESREKHQAIQIWPKSNPLWLYSRGDK